jgi:hypothetical protein
VVAHSPLGQLDEAVNVAVIRVRMMEVTVDEIVDMIAVRHGVVTTTGSVHVLAPMRAADVRHAAGGIHRIDRDDAIIEVPCVRAVEMTIVQKVDVVTVANSGVAAFRAVLVIVVCVSLVLHCRLLRSTHQMGRRFASATSARNVADPCQDVAP